jgi:hypothetical protein
MTAFAFATDTMFADPNMAVDAVYRAGGTGAPLPCRIILTAPDAVAEFNAGRFVVDTVIVAVRTAQVPALAIGDTFLVGSETLQLFGEPQRDALRLLWKAQAREV